MKRKPIVVVLLAVSLVISAFNISDVRNKHNSQEVSLSGSSLPIDSVKLGTQVWMTKNLDLTKFRNGDPIPEAKSNEAWAKAARDKQPAWCYVDAKYGKLYNWYALNDPRGLAPKGWHIPSEGEWMLLMDHLGGDDVAGTKLKSKTGWNKNGNGSNTSAFGALPGGGRNSEGIIGGIGKNAFWWSKTDDKEGTAKNRNISYNDGIVYRNSSSMGDGLSVRCLSSNQKIDSKSFSNMEALEFGSQTWATKNLDVTTFRNGDLIPEAKTAEEWRKAGENKQAAWTYYDNDPIYGDKYGKIYNWYAVNDERGLAPLGWHIPTNEEWTVLCVHLGGYKTAGKKMKSTSGWFKNGNGTNESHFQGLPAGYRYGEGHFTYIGEYTYWWTSSEYEGKARYRTLGHFFDHIDEGYVSKINGCSVRCVKD